MKCTCSTPAGCDRHRKFTCATCGALVSWEDGGADERPFDCSVCWGRWYSAIQTLAAELAQLFGSWGFSGPVYSAKCREIATHLCALVHAHSGDHT